MKVGNRERGTGNVQIARATAPRLACIAEYLTEVRWLDNGCLHVPGSPFPVPGGAERCP